MHEVIPGLTLKKQRSTIDAEISAPNPPVTGASWLIYIHDKENERGNEHDKETASQDYLFH